MLSRHLTRCLALSIVVLPLATTQGDGETGNLDSCTLAAASSRPCCQYVEKTVCVPTTVTEIRKVKTVECRPEVRERTITVCERIPETRTIQRLCTVCVPETRTRTMQCVVCKPTYKKVSGEYCMPVFETVMQKGVRKTCRMVPTTEMRTVCEDQGHWEERVCEKPCCGDSSCCAKPCEEPCTYRVWVPNCVTTEEPFTVLKPTMVEEPYEYPATVAKCEKRTWTRYEQCGCKQELETVEVPYTVCVRKQQMKTCEVTTCKCVTAQKIQRYTVMVPQVVEKEVPVTVCRMVPKTICVPACRDSCRRR